MQPHATSSPAPLSSVLLCGGRTVHPSPRSTVLPTPSHASGLLENLVFPSDKKEEGSFMVEMLREERGAPGNAGLPPLGALAAV